MNKLIDRRQLISINGSKWYETSILKHLHYWPENACENYESKNMTFNELLRLVKENFFYNSEISYFFKHPIIKFLVVDNSSIHFERQIKITERNFKSFKFKMEYQHCNETIGTLKVLLPADEYLIYLKDNLGGLQNE